MESGGVEIFPHGQQGKTRDIVADKSGIGSHDRMYIIGYSNGFEV